MLWTVTTSAAAQLPPTRGALILGAGRAGKWNTSIAVTNVDQSPLDIDIRANYCPFLGCYGAYVSSTIAPSATFVLPAIPDSTVPGQNGPQAVYVISSSLARPPVVSAQVSDGGVACERSSPLPVLTLDEAFVAGALVFAGIGRSADQYANLILAVDPPQVPIRTSANVRVSVRDSAGNEVGTAVYEVTSDSAVVAQDFLRELGVQSLEAGSMWLSVIPPLAGGPGYPVTAVIALVEPGRLTVIQGSRVADQ